MNVNLLKILSAAVLLLMLLTGNLLGMGTSPGLPQISIEGQRANPSPIILGAASVFMVIKNSGRDDDNLIGVRINIPGTVAELHDVKDGKMVKIGKIKIPSQGVVELRPRSLHIMVFKMPGDIMEGSELTLYLIFEKSGEKQIPVRFVRPMETPLHQNR